MHQPAMRSGGNALKTPLSLSPFSVRQALKRNNRSSLILERHLLLPKRINYFIILSSYSRLTKPSVCFYASVKNVFILKDRQKKICGESLRKIGVRVLS